MALFLLVVGYNQYLIAMRVKFFKCAHCGNVVAKLVDAKTPVICCGEAMHELLPVALTDENRIYLPVVELKDGVLHIRGCGNPHCQPAEHGQLFFWVATECGGYYVDPCGRHEFAVACGDDRPVAVYKYCSRHGLFKVDL